MAAKPVKPTAQQLAQAKLRARSSGIPMDTSAKGLRNAGKAIMVGASFLPAGRAVKGAATVVKATSTFKKASLAKATKKYDNALKAASGTKSTRPYRDVVESVKVKSARKQVGNPPNLAKAESRQVESAARGGVGKGPLGKRKDARVFTSKNPTADFARRSNLK